MCRGDNAALESPLDEGILNRTALDRPDCLLISWSMGEKGSIKSYFL
jgi:hypothetical protein